MTSAATSGGGVEQAPPVSGHNTSTNGRVGAKGVGQIPLQPGESAAAQDTHERPTSAPPGFVDNAQVTTAVEQDSMAGQPALDQLEALLPVLQNMGDFDLVITDLGAEVRPYVKSEADRSALAALLQQPSVLGLKPSFSIAPDPALIASTEANQSGDQAASNGTFLARVESFSPDKQRCRQRFTTALGEEKVLFETGKATIDSKSGRFLARLAQLSEICLANTGLKMIIEGHTDNVGSDELNRQLSDERAVNVREYLVGQGIDANLIVAIGLGEEQPIADNATPEGQEQNRRIEIKIED